MSEFRGLDLPKGPPQLEAEEQGLIRDLILDAPDWDPEFAHELVVLCRRHLVIRSAFKYAHTLAGYCKDNMLNEKDPVELYRRQGGAKGLLQFFETIAQHLQATQRNEEFEQ